MIKKLGPSFSKTGNSGATYQDGDIRHKSLVIECKVKSCPGFSSPVSELRKLWKEADKQGKDWLYIEQNAEKKVFVLMSFDCFLEMTDDWRNERVKELETTIIELLKHEGEDF